MSDRAERAQALANAIASAPIENESTDAERATAVLVALRGLGFELVDWDDLCDALTVGGLEPERSSPLARMVIRQLAGRAF